MTTTELATLLRELADMLSEPAPTAVRTVEPKTLSVSKYAKRTGFSVASVRRWVKLGLPHVQAGRGVRVLVAPADAWLAAGGARAAIERGMHDRISLPS